MKQFIEGADRSQSTLWPECLDDWVDESNPVRAVDAFVDAFDFAELGFDDVEPAPTGRPGNYPSALLKLCIYGYLNRIQSSRRPESEARRNLEVIWLIRRLAPDEKTICEFRKDNGAAIKKVYAQIVELCRRMGLLTKASVAIDGSKFKAVKNRDKNFTKGKVERRRKQLEVSVSRYLSQLESTDLQEQTEAIKMKRIRPRDKLEKLHSELEKLNANEKQMLASPDGQISFTDPDSRSMATCGRGSGVVGYNVQTAVDTEHHLIIAHKVTNSGSNRAQLANMGTQAKDFLGVDELEAVADRGYYSSEEIKAYDDAGIKVTPPKPMTSGAKSTGRFGKQNFAYLTYEDVYRCHAGEKLVHHMTTEQDGKFIRRYRTNVCRSCPQKPKCTPGNERRIPRWEHEDVLEATQERLDRNPDAMRTRRAVVEHPYGTIKMRMGATHFLAKGCRKLPLKRHSAF